MPDFVYAVFDSNKSPTQIQIVRINAIDLTTATTGIVTYIASQQAVGETGSVWVSRLIATV